jgi:hypothetical protein
MVFPRTCSTLIDVRAWLHIIRTCGSHLSRLLMKNPRYLRFSTGRTT